MSSAGIVLIQAKLDRLKAVFTLLRVLDQRSRSCLTFAMREGMVYGFGRKSALSPRIRSSPNWSPV